MKKSKVLVLVLCAVLLVAVSVLGTLAYLTDTSTATNTFTVGQVDITVDETEVNPDGTPTGETERVTENEYHLVPGRVYTKDPTMTVKAGSEKAYVRMLVTITNYSQLQTIYDGNFLPQNFVGDSWDSDVWNSVSVTENADNNTVTYEFRYFEIVDASAETENVTLPPLFTEFAVPGEMTGDEVASLTGLQIKVVGHAIQAEGFADADAAWTAFDAQMNQ